MANEKYNTGNIRKDAETAREAEDKAREILSLAFPNTAFDSVHDDKELWHTGDIRMSGRGFTKYLDIKDDGVIYRTKNVFAENHKYYHSKPNKKEKGFMQLSNYDLLGILDDVEKNLYLIDFKGLKKIYENYPLRQSKLKDCNSYGNCVPLRVIRDKGLLAFQIKYSDKDSLSVVDVKKCC